MRLFKRIVAPAHQQILDRLDTLLRERFGYRQSGVTFHAASTDTMYACRKKYDIYLRFKPRYMHLTDAIVIARMGFLRPRCGHGTALLRLLTQVGLDQGYHVIVLEACNANATAFGQKFGFEPIADEPGFFSAPVAALAQRWGLTVAGAIAENLQG